MYVLCAVLACGDFVASSVAEWAASFEGLRIRIRASRNELADLRLRLSESLSKSRERFFSFFGAGLGKADGLRACHVMWQASRL